MWQIHNVIQPSETSVMNDSKTLNVQIANVFFSFAQTDYLKALYW